MQTTTKDMMRVLGYTFKNPALLETALTHSSYANEGNRHLNSNERLEFLGDSVLGFITAGYLFEHETGKEGELTRLRASLVCEKALSAYAKKIHLGEYLLLGKGEQRGGGAQRASLLADAFEAVIAALYLDGGLAQAEAFILPFIQEELSNQRKPQFRDYKTKLQEIIQQNPEEQLEYELKGESGPDHDKQFHVEVHLNSNVIGAGRGKSKKEAEQQAAREALKLMGYDD
ncbi:MAG: ribonuclease III [Clostridia bacterium]|jgi:ribonuclease-3|nr:ribonuclease III [Clostridia bacterium]